MNTFTIFTLSILSIFSFFLIYNYIEIKRRVNKIKIGDKKRIFNSNETHFEIVEIKDIFKNEKGVKIAKCQYKNNYIEEIPLNMLIY